MCNLSVVSSTIKIKITLIFNDDDVRDMMIVIIRMIRDGEDDFWLHERKG